MDELRPIGMRFIIAVRCASFPGHVSCDSRVIPPDVESLISIHPSTPPVPEYRTLDVGHAVGIPRQRII